MLQWQTQQREGLESGCFVQVRLNHPRDALCAGKSRCFCAGWILWWDSRRNSRLAGAGRFPCAFMGWVVAREILTHRVNVVENGPAGMAAGSGGCEHSQGICPGFWDSELARGGKRLCLAWGCSCQLLSPLITPCSYDFREVRLPMFPPCPAEPRGGRDGNSASRNSQKSSCSSDYFYKHQRNKTSKK